MIDWAAYWKPRLYPRDDGPALPNCVPFSILLRSMLSSPSGAGRFMVERMKLDTLLRHYGRRGPMNSREAGR